MNLFELLAFLLLCAGLGFLGHFFSERWGWMLGAIPGGAGLVVILLGSCIDMVRETRHSFRSRPACQTGKCTSCQYVLVQTTKKKAIFRCRCGDLYVSEGSLFSLLLPDNSVRPYMIQDSSKVWSRVEKSGS
jgi:hypothetical protein